MGGVHAAVDVDVSAGPVALVVQRPGRVALVGPLSHGSQVAPGPGLVAERPEKDAWPILVPLHHAPHAVHQGVAPARIVRGVAAPADGFEAVALVVALVDDVQAVLVAQLQEPGVRRVVAGADGVEVVPLHQQHVLEQDVLGQGAAEVGVELVAVDPAEQDAPAVEGEHAVLDPHGTEADAQRHPLPGRGQLAVVQPGRLGRPGLHGLYPHGLAGGDVHAQRGHGEAGRHVDVHS